MDIKLFVSTLLALGIAAYFLPVENLKKDAVSKDIPLVIFEEPLMYTLNENNLNRVVQASHAVRYKNRDEMFNSHIILNNNDETKNFKVENLEADIIIKKKDLYTLIDNVKYTRDDFVTLNTNEMYYNDLKRIAYNNKPFEGNYYNHFVKGTNLYLDANSNHIKAKNAHFEIDMTKK